MNRAVNEISRTDKQPVCVWFEEIVFFFVLHCNWNGVGWMASLGGIMSVGYASMFPQGGGATGRGSTSE